MIFFAKVSIFRQNSTFTQSNNSMRAMVKERLTKKVFLDILLSLRNNDEQKKPHLKIFIRSRDNCN